MSSASRVNPRSPLSSPPWYVPPGPQAASLSWASIGMGIGTLKRDDQPEGLRHWANAEAIPPLLQIHLSDLACFTEVALRPCPPSPPSPQTLLTTIHHKASLGPRTPRVLSILTCADWPRIVPHRLPVRPQDAAQGGGSLHFVAPVAVVGDGRAELQVGAHSSAVLDGTRVKT